MLRTASVALVIIASAMSLSCDPEWARVGAYDLQGDFVRVFNERSGLQVLVFTRQDCPISNRYAPELNRLHAEFGKRAKFVLVYPDPQADAESIVAHRAEYLLAMPALIDSDHHLVDYSGVRITPEVAVYRNQRRVYRGRIDDRFVAFGKERAAPTTRDLRDVLTAMVAGDDPQPYETEAVGCHIQDLKP
ncbi:hypothetical protein ABI59_21330 [Acidobacteria bacterium Mor1]|nr:hypothetical protein ABI59_21330 [Acidobacteria bacterium Mor1]